MSSPWHRMADVLVSQQGVSRGQLDRLYVEATRSKKNFTRLLIERGVVSEAKLMELLSNTFNLPVISLAKYRIDPAVARLIPERLARQHRVIALTKFGDRLVVAMADPLNVFAIDDLKALTQVEIDPVLSSESEIARTIEQVYVEPNEPVETAAQQPAAESTSGDGTLGGATATAVADADAWGGEGPVVKAINLMLLEAMRRRASDIHLEPLEDAIRVRFRIDGCLVEGYRLPKVVQGALLTRLKLLSGLDITESQVPQDGRFKVRIEDREIDFRVSVLPLTHGGKVVLRLLDRSNLAIGLDHLGFLPDTIASFQQAIKRPYGMILVTGPTGSGKSTTLYAVLSQLNDPTRHLMTIEDPVEYQLEGIAQIQTHPDIGLTFASGLRALLRQSPDVVMIGEIRDFETADIAMKASLTGQLVLATLHTNDAPSAVTRLIDMGVEPFLVASSVTLIEAQRLVRRLCLECRTPSDPPEKLLKALQYAPAPGATFFKAGSCRMCNNTGFKGRLGILEVFHVDERARELIVSRASSEQFKTHAVHQQGMVSLFRDGLKKAEMGLTALEEVLLVATED